MERTEKVKYKIIGKGENVMITLQDMDGVFFDIDINDIEEIQNQNGKTWIVTTDGKKIQTATSSEAVMMQIMRARLGV